MSVYVGFAKGLGTGHKVAIVKTLLESTDISQTVITGNPPGILATIAELAKVDYAILHVLSGSGTFNASGFKMPIPQVIAYSANTFTFLLATVNSGIGGTALGQAGFSGDNMSGVIRIRAFIIGGAHKPDLGT